MTLSPGGRKLILLVVPALLVITILDYTVFDRSPAASAPSANADNIALAQQRAIRMRRIAALSPAREAVYKQTALDLTDRERGIIQADTAPQAQAALLEIARRVGKGQQIDIRGGDLGTPKAFGDYGLVYATVTFDCRVEQLVNFLADLTHQPELIVPSEERLVSGNAKDKVMSVRMVLAGVVAKKLVPEKKALGAF
jgi:hypothetical protein